jgi:hypothetical protein
MKKCTKCEEEKCKSLYHKNCKNTDGLHYHCKACRKAESLKQYGLTLESYDELLQEQGGVCKICLTDDPRGQSKAGRFYVDHNHRTGQVRGLLCNDCNTAIGLLKDSPAIAEVAHQYLLREGNYSNV